MTAFFSFSNARLFRSFDRYVARTVKRTEVSVASVVEDVDQRWNLSVTEDTSAIRYNIIRFVTYIIRKSSGSKEKNAHITRTYRGFHTRATFRFNCRFEQRDRTTIHDRTRRL